MQLSTKPNINLYDPDKNFPLYDIFDNRKKIKTEEIEKNLGNEEIIVTAIDSVSGTQTLKIFNKGIDTTELFGVNFHEEWLVTQKPFQMTKKVIGYSPIRRFYEADDIAKEHPKFNKVFLFLDTLSNDQEIEASNKRMILLTKNITYQYLLYNHNSLEKIREFMPQYAPVKESANDIDYSVVSNYSPYLNEVGIIKFVNLLLYKSLNEGYPVYDMHKIQLTKKQIYENLGIQNDTLLVENLNGQVEKKIVTSDFDVRCIRSLNFHEEWFFDKQTLRMSKKVNGVSLIRWTFKDDDIDKLEPRMYFVFTIYFDKKE